MRLWMAILLGLAFCQAPPARAQANPAPAPPRDDARAQIRTLENFLSRQLEGAEPLRRAVPESWLGPQAGLKEESRRLKRRMAELREAGTPTDSEDWRLLSLQVQFLDLAPSEREALLEEARAKRLAADTAEAGRRQRLEAIEALELHTAEHERLSRKIAAEEEERSRLLLEELQRIENAFSGLARKRARLAEIQKSLSDRLGDWWGMRDRALARLNEFPKSDAAARAAAWESMMEEVAARLRESNAAVASARALTDSLGPGGSPEPVEPDPELLTPLDRDSAETRRLLAEIRAKKVELDSDLLSYQAEEASLFTRAVRFQESYRTGLLGLRSRLLRSPDGARWRQAYLDSGRSPFRAMRVEAETVWANARFALWKAGTDLASDETAAASWDVFLWRLVSGGARLLEAILTLAAAIVLIRLKKPLLRRLRGRLRSAEISRRTRARAAWFLDLLDDFYFFIVLGVFGKIGHNLALAAGFEAARYFYPYVKLAVFYFLGMGLLGAIGPLLSQRKTRASGDAQADVSAVEVTFRLIPFYVLTYWVVWTSLELALRQLLGASVLERWLGSVGWSLFPFLLLFGVWRNREQWRLTCRRVAKAEWWTRLLDRSKGMIWEPIVLLLGGGFGVYLVAWRRIKARIAEVEVAKSFQAVLSRTLLQRAQRRSLMPLDFANLPPGYADAYGRRSQWRPEWHVAVEGEAEFEPIGEGWKNEKAGSSVLVIGERGIGKTALIRSFVHKDGARAKLAQLRPGCSDPAKAFAALGDGLAGKPCRSDAELAAELEKLPPSVLVVDNLENSALRKVGGFDTYAEILDLIVRTSDRHLWIASMIAETWGFVRHAFLGADSFSHRIRVGEMSEERITALIEKRHPSQSYPLDFSAISFSEKRPARWSVPVSEEERRRRLFFRILWDYTDGNPRDAMYFWGTSVRLAEKRAAVSIFAIPETEILDRFPDVTLMALAALIEHNGLSFRELCLVMNEPEPSMRRILEAVSAHGCVYSSEDEEALHLESFWIRAVKAYLKRRHFLFSGKV